MRHVESNVFRRVLNEHAFLIGGKIMLYEKKKLLICKIIITVLFLVCIIVPISISLTPAKIANIVDDEGFCDYDSSLNSSDVEIFVKFDTKVNDGYIKVSFYDESGKTLSTENGHFYRTDDDKEVSDTFYIKGNVKGYKIISSEITRETYTSGITKYIFIIIDIFMIFIFLGTMLMSCKVYDLDGKDLIVYSGLYRHYIKYDGTILDEHNTFQTYVPIYLSTTIDDETYIEVTISTMNRISLKVNDKLYTKYKY